MTDPREAASPFIDVAAASITDAEAEEFRRRLEQTLTDPNFHHGAFVPTDVDPRSKVTINQWREAQGLGRFDFPEADGLYVPIPVSRPWWWRRLLNMTGGRSAS